MAKKHDGYHHAGQDGHITSHKPDGKGKHKTAGHGKKESTYHGESMHMGDGYSNTPMSPEEGPYEGSMGCNATED